MNFPINFELNFIWVLLIASFIFLPMILMICKRWLLVISQTILIALLSVFITYLSMTGMQVDGDPVNMARGELCFCVFLNF